MNKDTSKYIYACIRGRAGLYNKYMVYILIQSINIVIQYKYRNA